MSKRDRMMSLYNVRTLMLNISDATITFFSETLGNVFQRDVATNVAFVIEVRNMAIGAPSVGNDILNVSGGNTNFNFLIKVRQNKCMQIPFIVNI